MYLTLQCRILSFSSSLIIYGILLLCFAGPAHAQEKPGRITGQVLGEKSEALAGATVQVEGKPLRASTLVSGEFSLPIAPGNYSLVVSFVGYDSKRITDVIVVAGKPTFINISLSLKRSGSLENVVVTASARKESAGNLLRVQKNSISMTDGISAELMKATPDNNIGQSLSRVSGVNVQGGKFVTIRGVSDRYNNVQINGSSLPSSEPNRRNFSFDIIPTSLVDNVVVHKTASPDLPGEFTGGLVQVNTRDIPTSNFIEAAVGTGFNTASNNVDYLSFRRDKYAALGKVNKERLWFGAGRPFDAFKFFTDFNNNDTAATRAVSARIPNRWQFYKYGYSPLQQYQLSGGLARRFKNSSSIGAIAALNYRNEQTFEAGDARSLSNYDYSSSRYKYATTFGGILNFAYKTKLHKLAWKNLYNLKYSNQADDRQGLNISETNIQRRFSDVTFQGKLFQTRLEGEHQLNKNGLRIDWNADDISFTREQPDSRYYLNRSPEAGYSFDFRQLLIINGGLFASIFDEHRNNTGINLNLPFKLLKEKENIRVGYAYSRRVADYDNTGLRILTPNSSPITDIDFQPYYQVVTADKFENGNLYYTAAYANNSSTGDSYQGRQDLYAWYGMADLRVLKDFRVTGGVRFERNKVRLTSAKYLYSTTTSKTDTTTHYVEDSWLPSVNLVYNLSSKTNIRLAASKTVARPDFVERTFVQYYDFTDQTVISGSSGLKYTTVQNYDFRIEYYPAGGEIVSASFFHKKFDNPVERNFRVDNPSNFIDYLNRKSAVATGFEADVRKNLGFLASSLSFLKRMLISCNFSYITGEVDPGDTTGVAQKRIIQGLAPYLINLGMAYEGKRWGANISFNRSGRKVINAGNELVLIQYEQPRSVLDAQVNTKLFKEKLMLRLNVSDMLNQPFIIYSNGNKVDGIPYDDPKGEAFNKDSDFVNYDVKRGVSFSLSAVYRF